METLKTRLEAEPKKRFQALAKAQGLTHSELLRRLVMEALETGDFAPIEADTKRLDRERIMVRMPRFLMDAAKARAGQTGMAPSRWIGALVQTDLMRLPVIREEQALMLEASNRELAAIGRNLNQIAKALNIAFQETDRIKLDLLADLKAAIETNRATIHELVRASRGAWKAD